MSINAGGEVKSETRDNLLSFFVGSRVRIRESRRSPYSGEWGVLSSVDLHDERAPYLVSFEDGTQYRYSANEVELPAARASQGLLEKIFARDSWFRSSPPNNPQSRINPSVPRRFGTRQ